MARPRRTAGVFDEPADQIPWSRTGTYGLRNNLRLGPFSGRGAKDTIPLYRAADASQGNITPGLLEILATEYERNVTPEDFLAYIYGVIAQPPFTTRFKTELGTRELRVPITKDTELFEQILDAGSHLLWLPHLRGAFHPHRTNARPHSPWFGKVR